MILVTGATGFVGAALTRQLVATGASVRILRRASSKLDLLGDVAEDIEHALGDARDPEAVHAAMAGCTHVYHTAAVISTGEPRKRAMMYEVNVRGTAHIVNAALDHGITRLVHTSSMAAFGRTPGASGILDETTVWVTSKLNSHYAISKYQAELEIHRGIAEGLDAVMVNPALVFGPGRSGENTMEVVENVRDGKLPAIPVGGTNVVDVADVADGHLRAMKTGKTGERYFLGSENLTWTEIIHTLAETLNVAPPKRHLAPKPALFLAAVLEGVGWLTGTRPLLNRENVRLASAVRRYDNTKAQTELGCTFRPFRETAKRIAEQCFN